MIFRCIDKRGGRAFLRAERDEDTGELTGRYITGRVKYGQEWKHAGALEDIPALWGEPVDDEAKAAYTAMHKAQPNKYRRLDWVEEDQPKRGPGRPRKEKEPEGAEASAG